MTVAAMHPEAMGDKDFTGWYAAGRMARGLFWAAIGFIVPVVLVMLVRTAMGRPAWAMELNFSVGYVFAVLGWVMGMGMWDHWGREWIGLKVKEEPKNWGRYFAFCVDHKVIGIQYLCTFVFLLLFGGLLAMVIRAQLLNPIDPVLNNQYYNQVMSMHGIVMVAVAVAGVVGSFGNYLVPIMVGADDMAFPRLNALSFWLLPPVVVLLLLSQAFGGWDSGWTAYPPLSVLNASGQVLFNLAIITFGLSSILGGVNFLVTIIFMRAPGLSWGRLPIFVWSVFAMAWIALLFTQFFAGALLMVLLDRIADTTFFIARTGGKPLLYQHIFWFYSHPAVYIFVLPAFGILLEVLPTFARKPVFAYKWAAGGFLGILGLSGLVWAHHMFTSGMSNFLHIPFLVLTEMISIPTGLIFLSALGTIWMGKLWFRPPMLFALAQEFLFLIGGITGIFLADVPTDVQLQDTYFVVAHFHYTIVGGEIFAMMAAIYYWYPKITGRMYNETLAKVHFWMMFLGFNSTFIPMFWAGLQGMNRRIATYEGYLQNINVVISIAAFVLGSSFIVFTYNMLASLWRGERAPANPWQSRAIEWQTTSPPPVENFPSPPVITGNPYDYGVKNAPAYVTFSQQMAAGD